MSNEIKLIRKDTVLPVLKPYDWDVMINACPYYVVDIPGYVYRIGWRYSQNSLWAYPRNETPSYDNLIEFNCEKPVCWGIQYTPVNFSVTKWDESYSQTLGRIDITRNGERFYTIHGNMAYGIAKAQILINEFEDHPLGLNSINYDKKAIGRKIWWRSEPAVITNFIKGQACIVFEPDGIDKFTVPKEFKDEDPDYYEDRSVKTSIMDKHIWWFREN